MLVGGVEHEIESLKRSVFNDEIQTVDHLIATLGRIGEVRGLQKPNRFLALTIEQLAQEIKQETEQKQNETSSPS